MTAPGASEVSASTSSQKPVAALRRVGNWAMRTRTSAPSGTSGDSARMVNTS